MIVTDKKTDPTQVSSTEAPPPPAYPPSHEQGLDHTPGSPHWQPVSTSYPAAPYSPTFAPEAPPAGSPYPPGPPPVPAHAVRAQSAPPLTTAAQQEALIGQQYQQQLLAQCARGHHDPRTVYGVWGIIIAVILFPIGLLFLFFDKEIRCSRCGVRLDSTSGSLA